MRLKAPAPVVFDDGTMRDPNNCLARMLTHYDFASGNRLPKDTVIEVEPRENPLKETTIGYWREKGTVFAVDPLDYEIIEGPITPRLFND
jgi:hypothetical protein